MQPRVTTIIAALVTLGFGLLALWFFLPSNTFTHPITFKPKVLPAFYQGGLQKGSGGKLEHDWDAYDPSNLFTPSQARNSSNALLPGFAFPSPESCGSCHAGIHDVWQQSLHSVSATDDWYLRVKEYFAFERGEPAVRLCAGCHAPVALMTGEVGLYNRESASSRQGVSCGFCHTLDAAHGGNGAYVSNPARVRAYFGADGLEITANGSGLGNRISSFLLWQKPQTHIQDMGRGAKSSVLVSGQVCQACHSFTINNVNVQSTWDEWQNSSAAKKGVSCQGCHFKSSGNPDTLEPGEIVNGTFRGQVYPHTLGGGSTIQSPRATENIETLKHSLKLESKLTNGLLEVKVTNVMGGHKIPTGVTDLRQLWLEVTAINSGGQMVFKSGTLDAAGNIQAGSSIFHVVLVDAQAQKLERHDIWRAAKILEDTRIPADGSSIRNFKLPPNTRSVRVRLLWRDAPASFAALVLRVPGSSIPVRELSVWSSRTP
jgi:Cytochrome c554 and c-prime